MRLRLRLKRALAVSLAIASTSVPAGIPDESEATLHLQQERDRAIRTALVMQEAQIKYIVDRYRQTPERIRRVVRASQQAGLRHGLPPTLLLAMVETESSFDTAARSGYGARGLMQIVPRHHPEIIAAIGGAHRLDQPEINIETGAKILAAYVERSGSLEKGLSRYSGGARRYADKVLKRQRELERSTFSATRQVGELQLSEASGRAEQR